MLDNELIIELINRVKKEKDDEAFLTLVSEFRYLLYSVFSKYCSWYSTPPSDLINDILYHFWEVIVNYDEEKTGRSKVRRYISNSLFQRIYNLHYKKKKRSLNYEVRSKDSDTAVKIILEDILMELKKNFGNVDYGIFKKYYVEGLSQQEVAKMYGVSQSFVSITLKKMRTFLKERMNALQFLL